MLSLLPALWNILEKQTSYQQPKPFSIIGLEHVAFHATTFPKIWVGGSIFLCCVALLGTHRFHFETDLEKLFNRDVVAMETGRKVRDLVQIHPNPWVITTKTIEEAQHIVQQLQDNPMFPNTAGIATLFPSDLTTRAQRLRENLSQLDQQEQLLRTYAAGPPFMSLPAVELLPIIQSLQRAAHEGKPDLNTIPTGIRAQVMGTDNSFITYIYGTDYTLDAVQLRRERTALQSLSPTVTGMGAFGEAALLTERPWLPEICVGIALFVMMVLAVDLRSPKWIILALTPVSVGTILTFGILCWANVSFSVMTLLVLPLILGLGVDDGLHVVHRLREDPTLSPHKATVSVTKAITMTTLTTCASFGILLATNHPGLESMATTLLVGLPICLLTSVTLVPALSVILKLRVHHNR